VRPRLPCRAGGGGGFGASLKSGGDNVGQWGRRNWGGWKGKMEKTPKVDTTLGGGPVVKSNVGKKGHQGPQKKRETPKREPH